MPDIVQADPRQSGRLGVAEEHSGNAIWVERRAILPGEYHPGVLPRRSPRQPLFELRWERRRVDVAGSSEIVRRPFSVFGWLVYTTPRVTTRASAIRTVPASRSTLSHRKPTTSPRRMPVVANSHHAASRRSPSTWARNRRTWVADHTAISLSSARGASTRVATLRRPRSLRRQALPVGCRHVAGRRPQAVPVVPYRGRRKNFSHCEEFSGQLAAPREVAAPTNLLTGLTLARPGRAVSWSGN